MSHNHSPEEFDRLESPLDAAVAAVLAEPIPDASIRRVAARATTLAGTAERPAPDASVQGHRSPLSRVLGGGVIAVAAVAALAVGISLFLDRGAGGAFAQVVNSVNAADSVRFTMTVQLGRDAAQQTRMSLEGDFIRAEFEGGLVQIADLARKQVLYLDTHRQLAQSIVMNQKLSEQFANPVDQIRRAKTGDAKSIGEEQLAGKRCAVFRLNDVRLLGVSGDMLMWVDPDSGLPVQFVVRNDQVKKGFEVRIDDFVWNEPIDSSLFALTAPDGYQSGEIIPQIVQVKPIDKSGLDAPNVAIDGILSRDRVPAQIFWNTDGSTLTSLMRDPESASAAQHRPHELRQWDVETGKLRWSVDVAGAGTLAQTSDGRLLAVATGEELQLRNAATGEVIHRWDTDLFPPDLAFSPDGKSLVLAVANWSSTSKNSGGFQIWSVVHGTILRSIVDEGPTTFVAYSPDGQQVACSSNSGPVRLWDVATGELSRVFPGTKCAFSPDGRLIACTSMEQDGDKQLMANVNLYDLESAKPVNSLSSERASQDSWLLSLAFSPNGNLLAAANWDGTATLWDVASGERKLTLSHHAGGVHRAVFSPDGSTLATGSEDNTLRLIKLPPELRGGDAEAN